MTPPEPLRRESGRVYAVPSFRILLHVEKPLGDPAMKAVSDALIDLFWEGRSHENMIFGRAGGRFKKLGAEYVTPKVIAKAKKWAAEAAWEWPSTLRFARWFDDLECSGPPHLRLEQRAELSTIQLELPPEWQGIPAFTERVTALISDLPVLWGVMGFGMFQPVALDSLIWMLPRVTPRYRCAIEVQPDRAESSLRRSARLEELRLKITPVFTLPDIGWRTFIGDEFLPRLPDLPALASQPGIALSRGDSFTVVQAGAAPIWGDVNMAEDITPYRAVAHALKPCKPEWIRVRNGLFGGYENDNGLERIEQWYHRFED